jgi:hypothetical protein
MIALWELPPGPGSSSLAHGWAGIEHPFERTEHQCTTPPTATSLDAHQSGSEPPGATLSSWPVDQATAKPVRAVSLSR